MIVSASPFKAINELYAGLEEHAVAAMRREGFADADVVVRREANVKFAGQSFEIPMTWPGEAIAESDRDPLAARFVEEYERVYGAGSAWKGFPIELHTARVVASGTTESRRCGRQATASPAPGSPPTQVSVRSAWAMKRSSPRPMTAGRCCRATGSRGRRS